MGGTRVLATVISVMALGACESPLATQSPASGWIPLGRPCAASAPVFEVPATAVDSLVDTGDWNQELAGIARRVPGGFGGAFVRSGVPTVYLVEPWLREAALAALRQEGISLSGYTEVLPGRWDFAQMYEWFLYVRLHSHTITGIRIRDIDEAENRISYGVSNQAALDSLASVLRRLDVPCYLFWAYPQGRIFAAL